MLPWTGWVGGGRRNWVCPRARETLDMPLDLMCLSVESVAFVCIGHSANHERKRNTFFQSSNLHFQAIYFVIGLSDIFFDLQTALRHTRKGRKKQHKIPSPSRKNILLRSDLLLQTDYQTECQGCSQSPPVMSWQGWSSPNTFNPEEKVKQKNLSLTS